MNILLAHKLNNEIKTQVGLPLLNVTIYIHENITVTLGVTSAAKYYSKSYNYYAKLLNPGLIHHSLPLCLTLIKQPTPAN